MSWGFFLDLDLTLPTSEWARLAPTKTSDHRIAAGWWGFQDPSLGKMFTAADFDDTKLGEAVELFNRAESIGTVTEAGGETTLRLCQLLDRGGDPSIAKCIAALVDASKASARGRLRLVNDGTYSGEGGVEIIVADGRLARASVEDSFVIVLQLGAEVYGDDFGGEDG